jgi:hypothetical protein
LALLTSQEEFMVLELALAADVASWGSIVASHEAIVDFELVAVIAFVVHYLVIYPIFFLNLAILIFGLLD